MATPETRPCEWCGTDKDSVDVDGVCNECRSRSDEWQRERRARFDRYRCRANDPSVLPMTWAEAVARVSQRVGHPIDVSSDDACEAATWWFVPHFWIGCSGFFVDKADGLVTQLGSCHPAELYLWAHERGFRYPCDLIVEQVHDLAGTVAFLESVLDYPEADQRPSRSWSSDALTLRLRALPVRFPHQELWFSLPGFHADASSALFEYRLEPSRGANQKAGAKRVLLTCEAFRAIAEMPDYVDLLQRAHDRGVVDIVTTQDHHYYCCHDATEIPRDSRMKITPEGRSIKKAMIRASRLRDLVPCRIVEPAEGRRLREGATPEIHEAWSIALDTVAPQLIIGDHAMSVRPGAELISVDALRLLLMQSAP